MTTIADIYAAINPMPAMLSKKGKVKPNADFKVMANAGFHISMSWRKPYAYNDWEQEYQVFSGSTLEEVVEKAISFINDLPTAEQAKLNNFMGKLGKLIDAGKDDGIEVAYLNPLIESMKKLSENVITYKPAVRA